MNLNEDLQGNETTSTAKSTSNKQQSYHHCYLLRSQSNPSKTYIGYTTNPYRRIKQHNGIIKGGANQTSKNRPWKIICVVSGFESDKIGLKFEWAWQNPNKSLIFRSGFCTSDNTGSIDNNLDKDGTRPKPKKRQSGNSKNSGSGTKALVTAMVKNSGTKGSLKQQLTILMILLCQADYYKDCPLKVNFLNNDYSSENDDHFDEEHEELFQSLFLNHNHDNNDYYLGDEEEDDEINEFRNWCRALPKQIESRTISSLEILPFFRNKQQQKKKKKEQIDDKKRQREYCQKPHDNTVPSSSTTVTAAATRYTTSTSISTNDMLPDIQNLLLSNRNNNNFNHDTSHYHCHHQNQKQQPQKTVKNLSHGCQHNNENQVVEFLDDNNSIASSAAASTSSSNHSLLSNQKRHIISNNCCRANNINVDDFDFSHSSRSSSDDETIDLISNYSHCEMDDEEIHRNSKAMNNQPDISLNRNAATNNRSIIEIIDLTSPLHKRRNLGVDVDGNNDQYLYGDVDNNQHNYDSDSDNDTIDLCSP
jgi:predicted GIY-YIG superfamily endonuclease